MTSINSCPDGSWTSLMILQGTQHSPGYFNDVQSWTSAQVNSYLKDDLRKVWIPSAVFTGIAVVALLLFAAWRLCRCCTSCCCSGRRTLHKGEAPSFNAVHRRLTSPLMLVLKLLSLLLVLATMGLTIYGMTQVKKDIVDQGWQSVAVASAYTTDISTRLAALGDKAASVLPAVSSLQDVAQNSGQPLSDALVSQINDATATIDQIASSLRSASQDVKTQVTDRIQNFRTDHYSQSSEGGKVYYYVTMVVMGLGLGLLLLAALAIVFSGRRTLCVALLLLHVWVVLYFAAALAMALGLGVENDGCPAFEPVVVHSVNQRWRPLATYYLASPLPGTPLTNGTLAAALKAANLVDVTLVDQQLDACRSILNQAVTSSPFPPEGSLAQALDQVGAALDDVQTSKDGLMQQADVKTFMLVYLTVKGYMCCTVAGQLAGLWIALTFGGWAMLLLCWIATSILVRLDSLPASRGGPDWVGPQPIAVGGVLDGRVADAEAGHGGTGAMAAAGVKEPWYPEVPYHPQPPLYGPAVALYPGHPMPYPTPAYPGYPPHDLPMPSKP